MYPTISLKDLAQKQKNLKPSEVILDVRNPDEFQAGHIPGAINIPLPELASRQAELKSHGTVYVHCKRGGRAKTACDLLSNSGAQNIVCLAEAGMDRWIEEGHPVA